MSNTQIRSRLISVGDLWGLDDFDSWRGWFWFIWNGWFYFFGLVWFYILRIGLICFMGLGWFWIWSLDDFLLKWIFYGTFHLHPKTKSNIPPLLIKIYLLFLTSRLWKYFSNNRHRKRSIHTVCVPWNSTLSSLFGFNRWQAYILHEMYPTQNCYLLFSPPQGTETNTNGHSPIAGNTVSDDCTCSNDMLHWRLEIYGCTILLCGYNDYCWFRWLHCWWV